VSDVLLITGVTAINIKVKDYKKAVAFYTNQLGLELIVNDTKIDRYEVAAQGTRAPGITFNEDSKMVGGSTGIIFSTNNIQETCQMLRKNGVRVTEPYQAHGEWWAGFKDLDGNSYGLRQT
jgi:predicted enzyme related to lactoylglutathione lyase